MLSTSILYCNKLDDTLLETIDNVSATTSTTGAKSKLRLSSNAPSNSGLDSSAISIFSQSANSALSGATKSRYRVRYLGHNTCDQRTHPLDHGIAAYQRTLLDLYTTVLRRSVVLRSLYSSLAVINQVADLSTHGIVIAERDRFLSSQQHDRPYSSVSSTSAAKESSETVVTKVITPLTNILLWAPVRLQFKHRSSMKKVKNSSVKRRQIGVASAAFLPLSCSEAVLDKNAFVSLNSKQRFLLGKDYLIVFFYK